MVEKELNKIIEDLNKIEKIEKKIEYWGVGEELYETPKIERGERVRGGEVIFKREQLGKEEIRKYTGAVEIDSGEEKFIGMGLKKYKFELPIIDMTKLAEEELKKITELKYERKYVREAE
jgi:hypothetical protein